MNILIVGRGAMGLLFSHFLIDHNISIKSRAASPSIFSFTNIDGSSNQHQLNCANKKQISSADCVICCVKSYDVSNVITELAPFINNYCPIILTNNGMGVIEQLKQELSISNPIYALLTTMAAKRLSPNHIAHTGVGTNQMGLVSGSADSHHQQKLVDILANALPHYSYSEQILTLQWTKLAINCAINALTAIYNVNNGELKKQSYKQIIADVIKELVAVAKQEEILLNYDGLINTIYDVIDKTASNSSSMREDVLKQQETEIDFINGFIYRLGQTHNIPTPTNAKLYKQVKSLTLPT
ncbi:2-dehydropantoate 2-reductase [Thalassotalea nanhaiensis]|uniref:2-dehydropantoate 2-reductase n=1 Tax=Thalassotalea nanhaiensis TaxID=3065648 RepID=A0ABY9TL53_9GAMM|nr:2-dehydropantoate 2-reductase [Colwelliaceae bacterium SQ345]